jgi:4-hydroxybenzoate polyprenyltransferase
MAPTSHPDAATSPGAPSADVAGRTFSSALLQTLRPSEWTKNLIVFAALLFGERLLDAASVGRASAAFLVFCALSGVVYIVNDVTDREQDRRHPTKRGRPIASGALSPRAALATAAVLGPMALAWAFWLSPLLGLVSLSYVALLVAYSLLLKHIVILDVLTIAVGFVLRAVAGAVAVDVPISQWLLVCTILLALFLGLSKRRYELVQLADSAAVHRPILGEYSPYLLDQMIGIVTASTVMSYVLYVLESETAARFGVVTLGLTIPFPLYGIFRYLYLIHRKGGGTPSELLLADRPLLVCVALWVVAVAIILYS